jgi:hypothetical protein
MSEFISNFKRKFINFLMSPTREDLEKILWKRKNVKIVIILEKN